jgi:hypothetical protein
MRFYKNFFQKIKNTIFGNAGFVQRETWESVCQKAYFSALNTKLSILANFKDKELIHFMSDLAI